METKNYYSKDYMAKYTNQSRSLESREKKSLAIIRKICMHAEGKFCDIGCGDGFFLGSVAEALMSNWSYYGGEYSDFQRERAAQNKRLVIEKIDLEKGLHYSDGFFDVAYSGEVIEHLYDPDMMVTEICRVLKSGGYFILTTPNMNSWLSRLLFPLGMQPINYECSTVSSTYGYSWLKRFKRQDWPVGHVRLFNIHSLKDILQANGFEIISIKGATFEFIPNRLRWLDNFFALMPSFASGLVVLARKI